MWTHLAAGVVPSTGAHRGCFMRACPLGATGSRRGGGQIHPKWSSPLFEQTSHSLASLLFSAGWRLLAGGLCLWWSPRHNSVLQQPRTMVHGTKPHTQEQCAHLWEPRGDRAARGRERAEVTHLHPNNPQRQAAGVFLFFFCVSVCVFFFHLGEGRGLTVRHVACYITLNEIKVPKMIRKTIQRNTDSFRKVFG